MLLKLEKKVCGINVYSKFSRYNCMNDLHSSYVQNTEVVEINAQNARNIACIKHL